MCPCRAFDEVFFLDFFFPSDIWVFVFFGGYLGLKKPHIFGEEKQKPIRKRLGKGTLNTCAKFQGLTLKKAVDIWTFVRLRAKITAWHRNYLVLVYIRFWAIKFDLILVLRSQFFDVLHATLYKHASEHLEAAASEKNRSFFFFSTVNAYLLLTSLKVCDWSGHIFGASASPRSLKK